MSKKRSSIQVYVILSACLLLVGMAQAQVDIERLRETSDTTEPEALLILEPSAPTALDSVCEVIGDLPTRDVVGHVVTLTGEVYIERLGRRLERQRRDAIMDDDWIVTGDDGYVMIRFNDGTLMSLAGNSRIHLYAFWYERSPVVGSDDDCVSIEMLSGRLRMITGDIARQNTERHEILVHSEDRIHRITTIGTENTDLAVSIDPADLSTYTAVAIGRIRQSTERGQLETGMNGNFDFARISSDGNITGVAVQPDQLVTPPLLP